MRPGMTAATIPPRAALYLRVSTSLQAALEQP